MRQQQNDSLPGARRLRDDVFHRNIALRRGRVKVILIHFAAGSFQLRDDVFLRTLFARELEKLVEVGGAVGQEIAFLDALPDFYGQCASYPGLRAAITDYQSRMALR